MTVDFISQISFDKFSVELSIVDGATLLLARQYTDEQIADIDAVKSVTSTDNHIVVDNTDHKNPSLSFQLVDNENLLTDNQLALVESAVQPEDLPAFGDIVTHNANEFAVSNHNHSLANLTERSYNSLTDLPNLSLLENVIDINTWFDSIVDLQPPLYEGQVAYVVDEKYLLTAFEEIIEETTQLNWYLLDFHWKIYVDKDADSDFYGKLFIYNGIELVVVPDSLVLGETSSTAFDGLRGKEAYDHSQTTGNPHGTTVSDLSDVDGEATTVSTGDSFFMKVGNLWKSITESNFLTWLGNTFQTKLTFSTDIEADKASTTKVSAIKTFYDWAVGKFATITDYFTKTDSDRRFVAQNGGTIYHITRWFTPTSKLDIAANGLSATITSGQFTSAMTGAKLRLTGGVNEPIITYVSSNSITLSFAVDSAFFGQSVAIADWGVYTIAIKVLTDGSIVFFRHNTGSSIFSWDGYNIRSTANAIFQYGFSMANNSAIVVSSTANPDSAKDIGLSRNAPGVWEVNNGTAGTERDVALRKLYQQIDGGTSTGDAVGDRRTSNVAGVEIKEICTVANATKGGGTWVPVETSALISLTDSNELIGAGSFIDLTAGKSGRGSIVFGDGVGYADFIFTSAGVVTLIQYTSNVFTSVQTGTNHVIIKDNGTNVRIVNEMGSTMNFNVKIQYN